MLIADPRKAHQSIRVADASQLPTSEKILEKSGFFPLSLSPSFSPFNLPFTHLSHVIYSFFLIKKQCIPLYKKLFILPPSYEIHWRGPRQKKMIDWLCVINYLRGRVFLLVFCLFFCLFFACFFVFLAGRIRL